MFLVLDTGGTEVWWRLHSGGLPARPGGQSTARHDGAAVPGSMESWPVGPWCSTCVSDTWSLVFYLNLSICLFCIERTSPQQHWLFLTSLSEIEICFAVSLNMSVHACACVCVCMCVCVCVRACVDALLLLTCLSVCEFFFNFMFPCSCFHTRNEWCALMEKWPIQLLLLLLRQ